MEIAGESTEKLECPRCGGSLVGLGPEDACAGVRCLHCDFTVVTTNTNRPSFDPTPYTVWITCAGQQRHYVIAVIGNAFCIGVKAARELIDRGQPLRVNVQALDVIHLHRTLHDLGLGIRIEPRFPWRLDEPQIPPITLDPLEADRGMDSEADHESTV